MSVQPIVVVSKFEPDPRGSASARLLHGFVTGARELGRDVTVRSWSTLPAEPQWRTKARALVRPRADVLARDWSDLSDEAIAIAEEPLSFPAVRGHPRSVLTAHFSVHLDGAVARSRGAAAHVQDLRAERAAVRDARVATAYSERVAKALGPQVRAVPVAYEMPESLIPLVDEPIAACVADWTWPPNQVALDRLRAAWPLVRDTVPDARLLVAGRGAPHGGDGIEVLGPVADSVDVLSQAALLAFPVPPSSGPKVKVLEAAALGLPVVTTEAGIEGLALTSHDVALVTDTDPRSLAWTIAGRFDDPEARAALAGSARAAVAAVHAPHAAAHTRLRVIEKELR